jgi:hypothetical protein
MEELDLHGFTVLEAKKVIEQTIARLPKTTKELKIIHGFHSGYGIKKLVQDKNGIRSKRIQRRRYTSNQGETILILE